MLKKNYQKFVLIISVLFIAALFAYITYKTPLNGDDWGYALTGSEMNPFKAAADFYQSWSGRFFSELWGFVVAPRKWLWNILNPLLFTGIFICLLKLGNISNKTVSSVLLTLAFVLSVDDHLRMETYSWIMGTTYVVPLCLSLIYFVITEKLFTDKLNKLQIVLSNICLLVTGLMMENIAGTMVGAIVILIIYAFFEKKEIMKYLVVNFVFSLGAFVIMRSSPGSNSRLLRDNPEWVKLSLFEKVAGAYPNFLKISFINNNYAILLFSMCLIILVFFNKRIKLIFKVLFMGIAALGVFTVFSFVLGSGMFNDGSSLYSMIFWPVYIVNALIALWLGIEDEWQMKRALFYLVVAGSSVLAMLFSPLYGTRSCLYLVFYLIVVSLIVWNVTEFSTGILSKLALLGVLVITIFVTADRTNEFITKYTLVGRSYEQRLAIIQYYQDSPQDEEAWIPRFPIYSVHGGDIESDDTYHLETFKRYYGLPQDADKIIFYFPES